MNGAGKDDKQRNRVIANNEAERQTTGDIQGQRLGGCVRRHRPCDCPGLARPLAVIHT